MASVFLAPLSVIYFAPDADYRGTILFLEAVAPSASLYTAGIASSNPPVPSIFHKFSIVITFF